jgi:hypothetical protein
MLKKVYDRLTETPQASWLRWIRGVALSFLG